MGKIKKFFRDVSIRKTFMVYVILFILLATLLSAISIEIADNIKTHILFTYIDKTNVNEVNESGITIQYNGGDIKYSTKDGLIVKVCEVVSSFSVPVFFSVCIVAAALLFYKNKLKKPIDVLNEASAKIAENNLEFNIEYDSHDEMGKLCASFEMMRSSLDHNNRKMWRSMEERKRLNAAFAHDLRTPLTVLRGYTDFLNKYISDDRLAKDKILSTVSTMDNNIIRLENYVGNMYSLQKLDEIEPNFVKFSFDKLSKQLEDSAIILCKDKKINFISHGNTEFINIDSEIVAQVFENLISNASRYANKCITVSLECLEKTLKLEIIDDGNGFSNEALNKATEPFYRGDNDSGKSHFGLGLNICKILCEKHGGVLKLSNSKAGGAEVNAIFSISEKFSSVDNNLSYR